MPKHKIPKRVLGVRTPKRLRRGRLGDMLASELGQEVLAEALVAAAGLLISQVAQQDSAFRKRLRKTGISPQALRQAMAAGAEAFADALHRGPPARRS